MGQEVRRGLDLLALALLLLIVGGIIMMLAGIWYDGWFWYGLMTASSGVTCFCVGIAIGENWNPTERSNLTPMVTGISLGLALTFALTALFAYWQSDLHERLIQMLQPYL